MWRNRARRAAGILVLVTLLSGCASTIIGKPSPDQAALAQVEDERSPLTAAAAFGDYTTIDYCSLMDAAALGRTAEVVDPPRVSLDNCIAKVKVDGQEADLAVGSVLDEQARSEYTTTTTEVTGGTELKRRLTIEKPSSEYDGSCYRYLVFADEFSLQANVNSLSTSGTDLAPERLCPLLEAALEHAASVVVEKRVGHLSFPAGSLGSIDACSVATDAEIGAHLGSTQTARRTLTKHSCRWGRIGEDYVSLYFSVDLPVPAGAGYVPETLGGRQAMVWTSTDSYCSAQTTLKPWPGAQKGEVETVSIFVSRYDGGDPCGVMRNVANTVFPRLPA
ncbi:hypothetical protein [Amycolatopsis magusensis]|uniref:DUF3558 domain-containing protein n=1 Tax=Amycolatopsis magusensis TaxID=882444 RepID=A0ABS4PGG3_9PSEU|nr:hypothetical protein [Amycolatopsis magusensis]MBP2178495.1 hypothetical protein [Amycolatopsis magusensis]